MSNPALIQQDIINLQDIEKVQFLQTLQSDPQKYQQYIQEKTGRVKSETLDAKRAAFAKVSGDMARLMDMDHNSIAALDRTNDLAATQSAIITEQAEMESSKQYNLDLTRRQVEINNWYYENKRETLFVLQLALLTMLTVTILITLTSYGFLSEKGSDYLIAIVLIIGAGTWLYRWWYTKNIRDARYWNRRKFEDDGKSDGSGSELRCRVEDDDATEKKKLLK